MSELEFSVPGSPLSQNRVYRRRGKGGGLYMTNEGKAFKEHIALTAKAARPNGWDLSRWFEVEIECHFDSRRPDLDGPVKLALDALQGVLFTNDRQVVKLTAWRALDRKSPRLEVKVKTIVPTWALEVN